MQNLNTRILAIESSCDDTSCAVLEGRRVLSNIVSGQKVHSGYGGVVPELASRDHQRNIVRVSETALRVAGVRPDELDAIAVTSGPGLMGSLLVGVSYAKSLSLALGLPIAGVNHMQAHILAHFIEREGADGREAPVPTFPFLCLTVSGGHTQVVKVTGHLSFTLLGRTVDDAVGEAFDKAARLLGLTYPGGPEIDRLAAKGDPGRFTFAAPKLAGYDYSFSGIKTSLLYFLQEKSRANPAFVSENIADICASYQRHLVSVLLNNLQRIMRDTGIRNVAVAGGVSANSELRRRLSEMGTEMGAQVFIPPFEYCTDNAAMIGIAAYYKLMAGEESDLGLRPQARLPF